MPRKRNHCGPPEKPKHKHLTEGAAWAHVRALRKQFPKEPPRIPYLCEFCGYFHVGREPGKKIPKGG